MLARRFDSAWKSVAVWRHDEPYRRSIYFLSVAQLISSVGSMLSYVAMVAVVYQRSGNSGTWVAAALVVMFGVRSGFGPWAGAIGDRFDRRRIMVVCDLTAAAAFVGIAFAHSLPLLVVLGGVSALAEAPFAPSAQAFLVMVVPEERRTWATFTRASSTSAGELLGGALGGFLVAAFGGSTAFLVNAASFLISAALISRIKGSYRAAEAPEGAHNRGALTGLRLVLRTPALRLTLLATSVGLLGTGMINVAEYPLFVNIGGGPKAYGAAVSGWALGAFVASRVNRRQGDANSERRRLLVGCAVVGLAIGLCGVVSIVVVAVVLFSIAGFASNTRRIAAILIFQRWAPDHVRARVFSALSSANVGAIGLAMIVSGVVLAALSPAGVCIASGLISLCALLTVARIPTGHADPSALDSATECCAATV